MITQPDANTFSNGAKLRSALWSFAAKLTITIVGLVVLPGGTWIYSTLQDHETRQRIDEELRPIQSESIREVRKDVEALQTQNSADHEVIKEKLGTLAEDMSAVRAKIDGGDPR